MVICKKCGKRISFFNVYLKELNDKTVNVCKNCFDEIEKKEKVSLDNIPTKKIYVSGGRKEELKELKEELEWRKKHLLGIHIIKNGMPSLTIIIILGIFLLSIYVSGGIENPGLIGFNTVMIIFSSIIYICIPLIIYNQIKIYILKKTINELKEVEVKNKTPKDE